MRAEAKTPKKGKAEMVVATDPPTVEGWRQTVVAPTTSVGVVPMETTAGWVGSDGEQGLLVIVRNQVVCVDFGLKCCGLVWAEKEKMTRELGWAQLQVKLVSLLGLLVGNQ